MHASIEQLLNLRDAAPEASDVAGHVNGCQRCQAELGRLRIVQVGLQSLPEIPAPEGSWEALSRKRPGKGSAKPMVFTGWFWTGSLAAALAVAVVLFGLLNQVPRGPESGSGSAMSGTTPVLVSRSGTETAGSAAKVGDMAQLMARSQQLEQVLRAMPEGWMDNRDLGVLVLPTAAFWQEPVVEVGETVKKKQLLARGVTHIFFQANVWIFTGLVFIVGIMMGIGKAAVYKLIPQYYPKDIGVVGGIVGVLGGLGGFVCPILFGYMLEFTGIWTTCWIFFTAVTFGCFFWMQWVLRRMVQDEAPSLLFKIEHPEGGPGARDELTGAT